MSVSRQRMLSFLVVFLSCSVAVPREGQDRESPPASAEIQLPRQECRTLLPRAGSGVWVVAVEDAGDPRLSATRQQVVLGEVVEAAYRRVTVLSQAGFVYFPAAAIRETTLWVVWSELVAGDWRVIVRRWRDGELAAPARISGAEAPALWPALTVAADGSVHCAWSAPGERDFDVWLSSWKDGRWQPPSRVTGAGFHEMRPSLAIDRDDRLWLAHDLFVAPGNYRVALRERTSTGWSGPVGILDDQQSPHLAVAPDGTLWVTGSEGKIAGWRAGRRVEVVGAPGELVGEEQRVRPWPVSLDESGRLWAFESVAPAGERPARVRLGVIAGKRLEGRREVIGSYSAHQPVLVHGGKVHLASNPLRQPLEGRLRIVDVTDVGNIEPGSVATREDAALPAPQPPRRAAVPGLRPRVTVDGKAQTIYYGELHTHLGEVPSDIALRTWVDRYYLDARYVKGLDVAAVSDHDWPPTTQSEFLLEQAMARALTEPGEFLALSGFEWSGDGSTRRRYGDRTVVFPPGFFVPPRITDPASNTPRKLHGLLRAMGAIDWPHHVGSPWAVMDWTRFDPEIEPVVEMTSIHGVFETYDEKRMVPVEMLRGREPRRSLDDPDVDRTSIQYALAQGHRFGIVGSSDSHTGLSRHRTGMLALLATDVTSGSVFAAWRARRVYAVRGGDRIKMMVRCGEAVLGGETTIRGQPVLHVDVGGSRPLERVEVIRDNRYVYSVSPGEETLTFEYRDGDVEPGEHFYYVRAWQAEGGYAWSSPIWVTVERP